MFASSFTWNDFLLLLQGARTATPASDMYSFGIIAYQVLTRELPRTSRPKMKTRSKRTIPKT